MSSPSPSKPSKAGQKKSSKKGNSDKNVARKAPKKGETPGAQYDERFGLDQSLDREYNQVYSPIITGQQSYGAIRYDGAGEGGYGGMTMPGTTSFNTMIGGHSNLRSKDQYEYALYGN